VCLCEREREREREREKVCLQLYIQVLIFLLLSAQKECHVGLSVIVGYVITVLYVCNIQSCVNAERRITPRKLRVHNE
jgi:hypothetical protein